MARKAAAKSKAKAAPAVKKKQKKPTARAAAPQAAPPQAAATANDLMKLIPEAKFKRLVKDTENLKTRAGEVSGEIGALIKLHVDKHHLDKKAFAIYRQLFRLSNNKLAVTLYNLQYMIDIGGLQARADEQAEMFPDGENTGDADEEGEADPEMDAGEEAEEEEAPTQPVSRPQFAPTRTRAHQRVAELAEITGAEPNPE